MRIYVRHMRKAITAGDLDRAGRIGIAAYRVANTHERRPPDRSRPEALTRPHPASHRHRERR
ncbi:hypothetical protein [Streptomyces sp. SID8352]|uniref:hypothetical protein n=1 Tax=Streptomyces sp. SID8352 TaxID=2690338 RepID=UPI001370B24B|nr:hypothetical protein [Streptomyces sp. SID8352]MYU25617.1 hypothetical protein [Streptomyces sp. SID8352]